MCGGWKRVEKPERDSNSTLAVPPPGAGGAGTPAAKCRGPGPFPGTVRHGAARRAARHGSWRDLFAEADRAMYAAKQARR